MFQKSNIKGLAILLYPLMTMMVEVLPKGQQAKLVGAMTQNWFPYGLAEMKLFKNAVAAAADALAAIGQLPSQEDKGVKRNAVLTRNVLETAQGSKVWRALRLLSDQAVRQQIERMGEVPIELNTKFLGFSWKVGVAQLNAELQSFVEASRDSDAEQKDWVKLAKTLTEEIGTLRKDNRALKEEFKQVAAVTGKESALFEDLKTTSVVECLDRIPQIDQLRRISEDLA